VLKLELSYRGLAAIALGLAAIWMLARIWEVILLVTVAAILMTALLPYVEWLCRKGWPRIVAVLSVFVLILLVIGGLFALVVPAMIDEFQDVRDNLPEYAADLEKLLRDLGFDVELSDRAEEIDWGSLISGRAAVDFGQQALFFLISLVTVLVLTAYLLVDAPKLRAFIYRFVTDEQRPTADRVTDGLKRVVGGYIRGQLITSLIIGVFTTAVLLAAGVPNAIAFGVLAAFADIIPIIGAFIAVIPPTVAAFQESTTQAIVVAVALLLYQQVEDRWLVPRVYGSTLGLQPLVVLVAVLVGAELLGIVGILLALPVAAALKVLLDIYLDRGSTDYSTIGEILAPDEPRPVAPDGPKPGADR
jgi:predicted PurR-regulated permease PerM